MWGGGWEKKIKKWVQLGREVRGEREERDEEGIGEVSLGM